MYEYGKSKLFDIKPEKPQVLMKDMWNIREFSALKKVDTLKYNFRGFQPFNYQAGIYHDIESKKWVSRSHKVLPRRAGKTIWSILYLIIKSLEKASKTNFPFLKYGLLYPDLTQAKEVAWEWLSYYTEGLPKRKPIKNIARVEYHIRNMNGITVKVILQLVGLKDFDSRRGGFFDGIILDERKDIPPGFEPIINPMTSDESRQPTFRFNVGTPSDDGSFWDDYDSWRGKQLKGDPEYFGFWTNYKLLRHLSPKNYALAIEGLSEAEVDIEYGCKRGVKTGANYFADLVREAEENNRIRHLVDMEDQRKFVAVDIGSTVKDLFAMWILQFNRFSGRFEFLQYHQLPNATEEQVVNWLVPRYNVKEMCLPWDGATGMSSPLDTFQKMMPNTYVFPLQRVQDKLQRIREARRQFSRCDFDLRGTVVGVNCLKRYSKVYDLKNKVFLAKPKHDQYSHGADAFTHFAMALAQDKWDLRSEGLYDKKQAEANFADSYDPTSRWKQGGQQNSQIISLEEFNKRRYL